MARRARRSLPKPAPCSRRWRCCWVCGRPRCGWLRGPAGWRCAIAPGIRGSASRWRSRCCSGGCFRCRAASIPATSAGQKA
ncbi:MAG: hypothetical protein EA355_16005, partial [Rhodobacteraceae bacterium]